MSRLAVLASGLALLCAAHLPASAQAADEARNAYERGVVGLEVTYQAWDADRPWAKSTPGFRDATAVYVGDGRLLTTAQMVDDATFMQISTFGKPRSVEAHIVIVDRDVNLALLTVDDPTALDGLVPVRRAKETPTSGVLRSVRWHGQQLESAASRVARFVVERSWASRVEHAFLHMRTDMNGGGWSEPVFDGDRLVGVTVSQSQETSRAIPIEILNDFLDGAKDPQHPYVFPTLGILWQVNRDAAVAGFLGQAGDPTGILVRQVPWGSSACGVLKARDILLELDGQPIDAEGYFTHPRLGQLNFNHVLAERHRAGDVVPVKVLRQGKVQTLRMTLRGYPDALDLIPSDVGGAPPYVIAGGLILRELDVAYLTTWGKDWSKVAPIQLLSRYYFGQEAQTADQRRTVVLTAVLPAPYNLGYQDLREEVVERINGRPIGGIPDVVAALAAPLGDFHVFDLARDSTRGQVVLDAAGFAAATAEILDLYGVPAAFRLPDPPPPPAEGECSGEF